MTDRVLVAARNPLVVARFRSHVRDDLDFTDCHLWTGAISGRGHGRFWVQEGFVVIAHRLAYAIAHPELDTMPVVVAHRCDNPICQNDNHFRPSDHHRNRAEWLSRRHTIGGPLRDTRGARGRSVELRDAARDGLDITRVERQGVRPVDRDQPGLW